MKLKYLYREAATEQGFQDQSFGLPSNARFHHFSFGPAQWDFSSD